MSVLLKEIRRIDPEAAAILEDAKFITDSDLQFLSREDLRELFPGNQQLKCRKTIFDIIHKKKPVNLLLQELRDFIPHESLRAALTDNGVLVDYLHILKDMKTQMDNVQTFLEAHINLLEDINKPGPGQELQNGSKSTTSATTDPVELSNNQPHDRQQGAHGFQSNTSASGGPVEHYLNEAHEHQHVTYAGPISTTSVTTGQGKHFKSQTDPQGASGSPVRSDASGDKGSHFSQTVKYRVVVSGQTFGAHAQLMDKIKALPLDCKLQLVDSSQDPQIVFVFCPIVSRLATDANAALGDVKDSLGDASIILVLMHHVHGAKCVTHLRTWDDVPNVALYVHVFYHEKVHGLLRCPENKYAVSQIQSKVLEMHPCKYTSAQDVTSMTGSFTGGRDNIGSQNDGDNNSGSKPLERIQSGWNWLSGRK